MTLNHTVLYELYRINLFTVTRMQYIRTAGNIIVTIASAGSNTRTHTHLSWSETGGSGLHQENDKRQVRGKQGWQQGNLFEKEC